MSGNLKDQELLKQAGLRLTPQRLAIIGYMRGTKAHPSPETVYEALKPTNPGLSLNTVYQTLRALEDAGLVRRISMEENVYRYDANVAPHAHLVCLGCDRVDDTNGEIEPLLMDLLKKVRTKTDWDVRTLDCCFYGYCPDCRAAGRTPKKDQITGGMDHGSGSYK